MSKKKKILLSVLVVLVIGSIWGTRVVKRLLRGGDLEDIAVYVPADAAVFVANRGAGEQIFEFSRMGDIMNNAGPRTTHYVEQLRSSIEPILGFDPFVSQNWRDTGMSFFRPAGFAVAGDSIDTAHLLFFLPIGSEEALLSTLNDAFTRAGGQVDTQSISSHTLHSVKGLGGFFPIELHYAAHDDYLIGVVGLEGGFEPIATLERVWNLNEGGSLLHDPSFSNRVDTIGSQWHTLTYTSPKAMETALVGLQELANMYGVDLSPLPLSGSALMGSTHLMDDRLRYRAAQRANTNLVDASWFEGVSGSDTLGSKVPGDALLAGRVSINLEAIWNGSLSQDMGAEAFIKDILSSSMNIEIEKDLVQNLTGDMSFAVFEPDWENTVPRALVYMPMKDPEPIVKIADTGCRLLSLWGFQMDTSDNEIWCSDGSMLFLGVAHGHLLAGTDPNPKAYRSLSGPGYLAGLPKSARQGIEDGPPVFAHIDLHKILELVEKNSESALFDMLGSAPPSSFPPQLPLEGFSMTYRFVESSPESQIERQTGKPTYDSLLEVQSHFAGGSLQNWMEANLENMVVWMEDNALDESGDTGSGAASAEATMKEMASWQVMGAEELGEPYAACASEEKSIAIVNGGDPNEVYTNEDRSCLENIGWPPVAGSNAFWSTVTGPPEAPTGFTIHGVSLVQSGDVAYLTPVSSSPGVP